MIDFYYSARTIRRSFPPGDRSIPQGEEEEEEEAEEEATDRIILVSWVGKLTEEGLLRRQFPSLVEEKNIYVYIYIYLSNDSSDRNLPSIFFFTFFLSIGKDRSSSGRLTLLKQLGRLSDSEIFRGKWVNILDLKLRSSSIVQRILIFYKRRTETIVGI